MNQQQMINDIVNKGYGYNEIARICGGYAEKYSAVARGHQLVDGSTQTLNQKWTSNLKALHKDTQNLEENEHKFGKKRDWHKIIKALNKRGFSIQHISDIVGCQCTHIRDIISNYKEQNGKSVCPAIRIQDRLYQLYTETEYWPDKKIHKGNHRTNSYFTMVSTVGHGWQV